MAHNTRKMHAPVFGKMKMNVPPYAGVVKKAFFSRSKSRSVAASAGAGHARRAVLSGTHAFDADDKNVLLIIPEAFKTGGPDSKASLDDR